MPRQSKAQRETIHRVMHEFKEGRLESSQGRPVKRRRRAIAIALSEAGASDRASPERNRRNLARTKRRERTVAGEATKADLYAEARRRNIPGRSRMSKGELQRALRRRR